MHTSEIMMWVFEIVEPQFVIKKTIADGEFSRGMPLFLVCFRLQQLHSSVDILMMETRLTAASFTSVVPVIFCSNHQLYTLYIHDILVQHILCSHRTSDTTVHIQIGIEEFMFCVQMPKHIQIVDSATVYHSILQCKLDALLFDEDAYHWIQVHIGRCDT